MCELGFSVLIENVNDQTQEVQIQAEWNRRNGEDRNDTNVETAKGCESEKVNNRCAVT